MSKRHSFTQQVLEYLTERPGIYVEAIRLEAIGGRQAWRTRLSEARQLLEARGEGTIKNRQRSKTDTEGRRWTLSEYAFIPAQSDAVVVRVDPRTGQSSFV